MKKLIQSVAANQARGSPDDTRSVEPEPKPAQWVMGAGDADDEGLHYALRE